LYCVCGRRFLPSDMTTHTLARTYSHATYLVAISLLLRRVDFSVLSAGVGACRRGEKCHEKFAFWRKSVSRSSAAQIFYFLKPFILDAGTSIYPTKSRSLHPVYRPHYDLNVSSQQKSLSKWKVNIIITIAIMGYVDVWCLAHAHTLTQRNIRYGQKLKRLHSIRSFHVHVIV
jgi:hypothetical protein